MGGPEALEKKLGKDKARRIVGLSAGQRLLERFEERGEERAAQEAAHREARKERTFQTLHETNPNKLGRD